MYFVRVSLVEMNTLFNVMNVSPQCTTFSEMDIYFQPLLKSGISAAESNLALLMQDIAVNFFPWKDTKTNLQKIMPWISAGFNAAFSFIPEKFLERYLNNALVGTIQEFSSGGIEQLSNLPTGIPPAYAIPRVHHISWLI